MKRAYRQFWLTNEKEEIFWLNGESGAILMDVTGIGYEDDSNYTEIGDGWFSHPSTKNTPQTLITGTMVFVGKRKEDEYNYMADWILKSSDIFFNLSSGKYRHYRRRVHVSSFVRPGSRDTLHVPITFAPLSPWYLMNDAVVTLSEPNTGFFIVGTDRVGEGTLTETAGLIASVQLEAEGQLPSSISFVWTGKLVNPVITLTANGKMLGRCAINATIENGYSLSYSTEPGNSFVRWMRGSQSGDIIDAVDLTSDIYPLIPLGVVCTFTMTAMEMTGNGKVTLKHFMKGV